MQGYGGDKIFRNFIDETCTLVVINTIVIRVVDCSQNCLVEPVEESEASKHPTIRA